MVCVVAWDGRQEPGELGPVMSPGQMSFPSWYLAFLALASHGKRGRVAQRRQPHYEAQDLVPRSGFRRLASVTVPQNRPLVAGVEPMIPYRLTEYRTGGGNAVSLDRLLFVRDEINIGDTSSAPSVRHGRG